VLKSIAAVTAAIALTACSGSPIKQIVCVDDAGERLESFTFDPKAKAVYEYDSFSESLIPYGTGDKGVGLPPLRVVLTDSEKIKIGTTDDSESPERRWSSDTVIDLKAMTYEMTTTSTKSLLKDFSGAPRAEWRAIRDHNLKVLESDRTSVSTTKKTEGSCKYEKPISTKVAGQ